MRFKKFNILIRKGTTDLNVAISSFFGEFEILQYLLPKDYKGVIVDAGGYIGTSALVLNDMFPFAKIITIEPSKTNFQILEKNVVNKKNIKVVYGALVGKSPGKITLKKRGTGEWGYTVVDDPLDNPNSKKSQSTPAVTFKSLGLDPKEIGILKLDIEGGEFELFKHDSLSLNDINIVFAELHDRIIDGCTDLFFKFSEDRILIKDKSEKYLSIKK